MPQLRCLNPECGHQWFEASRLAEGEDCVECGGATELVEEDEDELADEGGSPREQSEDRPRTAYARRAARALLARHGIDSIPTPVRRIARLEGLQILERDSLPSLLRGRLVGEAIEIPRGDSAVVKRFSIAHELGHHRMGTLHDQGRHVEAEANAFANELLVPGPKLLEALRSTTRASDLVREFRVSKRVIELAAQQHRKTVS